LPAVAVLTSKGWAVQLVHVSAEPAGDVHGFVKIKDEAGTVLVECQDFQHNRKDYYMKGEENEQDLADLMSSVPDAKKTSAADAAPAVDAKAVDAEGAALRDDGSEVSTTDPEKDA